jgi:hypothetical protein
MVEVYVRNEAISDKVCMYFGNRRASVEERVQSLAARQSELKKDSLGALLLLSLLKDA